MRAQLVFLTALLTGVAATGCFDYLSDSGIVRQGSGTGGTGTGGTGGTSGSGGTGGTTTSAPPECIPANASMPVEDECGIFVSDSLGNDDDGKGTKASPVKTLTKALALANAVDKPVYVCGETFPGPIELSDSGLLYGALDCKSDWKHLGDAGRTQITAEADVVPLRIRAGASLEMHEINVTAADAATKGGSSIGIVVEGGAGLSLVSCDVATGAGAAGQDGEASVTPAADGLMGNAGKDACTAGTVLGGDTTLSECGETDSTGGIGGIGVGVGSAGSGSPGTPQDVANPNGGVGASAGGCGIGQPGNPGGNGGAGAGATGSLGTLTAELGFTGTAGEDGKPGDPGQGGGGGGGSLGGTGTGKCSNGASAGGASGGSGGSGGCGGVGGKAGKGGGSAIAIASFGATLKFDSVNLKPGAGGMGGKGAAGQSGGSGKVGGPGGKADGFNNLLPGC